MKGVSNSPTALVIDDETDFLSLMESLLIKKGFNVLKAQNSDDAFKIINEQIPGVVIVDIMMPGMNGWEISRKIKSDPKTRTMPIMIVSVIAEDKNKWKSFKYAGADWHIPKPFDNNMILFIVESAANNVKGSKLEERIKKAVLKDEKMKKVYSMINPKLLDHKYDFLK